MISAVGYWGKGQAILKIRSTVVSSARWLSDSGHVLGTVLGEGTSPPFAFWRDISLPGAFWRLTSPTLCPEFFISVYCILSSFLCLLYVAVHVSFCILLRDSHSPQGSNLSCGFLLSSPCQNPHIAQPYCLFLPTQPSSRMPSQMLGLCCLFPKPLPLFQAFAVPTSLTPISLSFCHSNRVLLTG